MSNLAAARSGDRREALVALRDTLAGLLDSTEAQVHAQLAAQYRAVLADLAALDVDVAPAGKVVSASERFAARVADANPVL